MTPSLSAMDRSLNEALLKRETLNRTRRRRQLASAQSTSVWVDGKEVINFCSNDYLGLANHPAVRDAFAQAATLYGVGSGASHLVCGHSREHHALEEELAAFTGRDRALLFSTGYMANLGCINTLVGRGDGVFQDKLNHASLLDGGLSSGATFYRYNHNDMAHLTKRLAGADCHRKLIVTDGIFSMDGDAAKLTELAILAERENAWLMMDDAHGLGVLGANGGGLAEQCQLDQRQLPILMGTLGKAFGGFGAFVAGSDVLIETLIQFARTYIYTTALPPAVAAANRASLQVIQAEPWRRQHLHELIVYLRAGIEAIGLPLMPSLSPIQPIVIGDDLQAMKLSQLLADSALWVGAIRPPTVPENTARMRITLCANHQVEHIDRLLDVLAMSAKQLHLI